MLSTIRSLPSLAAQLYRSGQAFLAVRQLHRGAAQGTTLDSNPGLIRLAKALQVTPLVARDIYLGQMSKGSAAEDLESARKTLHGARLFAPLSRSTSLQSRAIHQDVVRSYREAFTDLNGRAYKAHIAMGRAHRSFKQAKKLGQTHQAARHKATYKWETQRLSDLGEEIRTLSKGLNS